MIKKNILSPNDLDAFEALQAFGFGEVAITNAFLANKKKKLEILLDWLVKNEDSSLCKVNFSQSNKKIEENKT